jgi:hypothetical protein
VPGSSSQSRIVLEVRLAVEFGMPTGKLSAPQARLQMPFINMGHLRQRRPKTTTAFLREVAKTSS